MHIDGEVVGLFEDDFLIFFELLGALLERGYFCDVNFANSLGVFFFEEGEENRLMTVMNLSLSEDSTMSF